MDTQLPQVTRTYQNHLLDGARWQHYRPRQDDVVITTSYKLGTTWMQEIVGHLILLDQESSAPAGAQRRNASVWFEPRWRALDEVIAELEAQQHRRFIKSHLPLDGMPFYPQVKYIVVGRDARDVFMSLWNHHANFTPAFVEMINNVAGRVGDPLPAAPEDIHEFWRDWISRGKFEWESEGYPWWGNLHHTRTCWAYRHLANLLFVHYNDLQSDLVGEVRHIADFLNIPLAEDALQSIAQAVTFDAMRARALNGERDKPSSNFAEGAKTFFFKGTNGRWRDVLSAEELALYDQKATQVLTPECRAWLEQSHRALGCPAG